MSNDATTFSFYVADSDRSTKWNNHTFVLQLAFFGYGMGPDAALAEAKEARREDYVAFTEGECYLDGSAMTEELIAVRQDNERSITLTYTPEFIEN